MSGTGHRNKTAATFSTAVVLNYYFEQAQHLRIGVYDVDDFHTDAQKQSVSRFQLIGQAEALLGEIVGGGGGTTLLRDLMHPDHLEGVLHVHLQANPQEAVISLLGPGQPPPQAQDAMAERSFGPALSLAQARRVFEAHGGSLSAAVAAEGKGFLLTGRLPHRQA